MDDFFQQVWDVLKTIVLNLTNPDEWQKVLHRPGVFWAAFVAVTAIVFTETGLLVGFFLPGDSLLVTVGLVAGLADPKWPIHWMILAFWAAAVLGDSSGYLIGRTVGPRVFQKEKSFFFRKKYLLMAKAYYEKHGGKTIVMAKFVPFIRTFAPVVAGAGHMPYRRFLAYSLCGAGAWISSMLLLGYFIPDIIDPMLKPVFGPDFRVAKHVEKVILVVILVSGIAHRLEVMEGRIGREAKDGSQSDSDSRGFRNIAERLLRSKPMPSDKLASYFRDQLAELKTKGLYKAERRIETPQLAEITVGGKPVVNFCANNYLGLANHPAVVEAAQNALKTWGYGLSSVRFICGTQGIHKETEQKIAKFFRKEDSILYISCFDANGGLFEPLLGEQDAILSDELNHASIIDGVRLCKAQRFRYKHNDLTRPGSRNLKKRRTVDSELIFTDSVFSMDGDLAKLPEICELADTYDAAVGIDDCHGTGHLGATGRGVAEELGVLDRIDIITGTLGKTLGGASGGFTAARAEVVDWLRNRSRPYLFSNSVPPSLCAAGMKAIDLIDGGAALRAKCRANAKALRSGLEAAGFTLKPGPTPILPVMLGDAAVATNMANELLKKGIYVIGFSFPVVPQGQARIRIQVSAAHTDEQISRAISAFTEVGRQLGVIRA